MTKIIEFPQRRPDTEVEKAFMKAKWSKLREYPCDIETTYLERLGEIGVTCIDRGWSEPVERLVRTNEAAQILGINVSIVKGVLKENNVRKVERGLSVMWVRSDVENLSRFGGLTKAKWCGKI